MARERLCVVVIIYQPRRHLYVASCIGMSYDRVRATKFTQQIAADYCPDYLLPNACLEPDAPLKLIAPPSLHHPTYWDRPVPACALPLELMSERESSFRGSL